VLGSHHLHINTFSAGQFPFKSGMSHISCVTLQFHNLPSDWATELFKPSKDASLVVQIFKELESFGCSFIVGNVISGVGFWHFWLRSLGSGPQLQTNFFTFW